MNKYKAKYKDFNQFCKSFKTVEDVLRWYKANKIKWPQGLKDGNDKTFMWPNYIINHKTGNCWDHGLFMHYFCMKHNIPHRLLYIQSFFETKDRKICIGHCIGLYQSEDGVKFFNYTGDYVNSNEFGPFKSFKEAIESYAKRYNANAYNYVWNNPEVFNVDKKCFWVVQDENETSLTYDKYYDTYKVTQNEVFDKECLPLYIKKYGAEYPRDTNIKRSIIDIGIHAVKAWISQNIGRPIFKLGLPTYETGLMASTGGAVTGAYGRPFVMQVMSPTFVRPKYAVSNDILTDKILTTDDNDTLSMMDSDYLKGKAIRMFKYNKDNGPAKLNKILESIGQKVNREFIYECIAGKEMFTDDQLYIDEDFTEVDFASLSYLTENTAYSVMNKFIMSSPEYSARLRRREICNVESVNKLKGRSSDIVIMEDANKGYFAMNKKTLNRTKYFNSISEMTIGSDIDGNVC